MFFFTFCNFLKTKLSTISLAIINMLCFTCTRFSYYELMLIWSAIYLQALILINSASLDSTESNIDIIESTCQAMSEPVIPASTCRHMYLCCLLNGLVSCSKQHGLQFHQLIFKTVCQLTQQQVEFIYHLCSNLNTELVSDDFYCLFKSHHFNYKKL